MPARYRGRRQVRWQRLDRSQFAQCRSADAVAAGKRLGCACARREDSLGRRLARPGGVANAECAASRGGPGRRRASGDCAWGLLAGRVAGQKARSGGDRALLREQRHAHSLRRSGSGGSGVARRPSASANDHRSGERPGRSPARPGRRTRNAGLGQTNQVHLSAGESRRTCHGHGARLKLDREGAGAAPWPGNAKWRTAIGLVRHADHSYGERWRRATSTVQRRCLRSLAVSGLPDRSAFRPVEPGRPNPPRSHGRADRQADASLLPRTGLGSP